MNDVRQSDPESNAPTDQPPQRLTPWQIVSSTAAAAFGVQSSKNRNRDFTRGKPSQFIVAGIVFTALFVIGMVLLVRLVLSLAT